MLKVVNGGAPKTTKLILGFDAGCGTCADLAAGVQEKVGDKLEVQNLNDPQLMAWREEALGKNAKWTPTLFEVEGEKVLKAWAGWRMGYALSRKLGPSSTWQVMQALGEAGGAPRVEESAIVEKLPEKAAEAVVGMSRGQFLKGVGGAAVAASVLSSGMLFPSAAEAATGSTGTPRQRIIAKSIVKSSKQYKSLGVQQGRIGADFNWNRSVVRVVKPGKTAFVAVPSYDKGRSVVASFYIDFRRRRVNFYSHWVMVPTEIVGEVKIWFFDNGRLSRRKYIVEGSNYIITSDGQKMSYRSFREMVEKARSGIARSAQEQYLDPECVKQEERDCLLIYNTLYCKLLAPGSCLIGASRLPRNPTPKAPKTPKPNCFKSRSDRCKSYVKWSDGCVNRARSGSGGCLKTRVDRVNPPRSSPPPSVPLPPRGKC